MAKLNNFFAIAITLLALSASHCLAATHSGAPLTKNQQIVADFIISPAGENMLWDELEGVLISPTGQKLLHNADGISPAAAAFLEHGIDRIASCQDQLSAGGLEECAVTVYDVLKQKDGPAWEDQCCRNIIRLEQGCWDVLFPNGRKGRDLLPILLDYCNAVVQAPAAVPGPSPSA